MARFILPKAFAAGSNKHGMNNAVKVKVAAGRLQRLLSGVLNKDPSNGIIKGGYFAVIAFEHEKPRRLMLPLTVLKHPGFLSLLEKAAEEYGFEQQGALTLPCSVTELERMLAAMHNVAEESSRQTSIVDILRVLPAVRMNNSCGFP